MNSKKNKRNFEHGFTSMDNRIFYLQEQLTPNAFSIIIRLYRMTEGYDGKPKALANAYFQKTCNMSKNTVTKALKELEDLKLIYTKRRPRVSTLYLINLEKVDDIFQQVRASIISEFDNDESQNMGNIGNDESQNMTQCFPIYDLPESQNMGTNKENTKENIIKENTLSADDVKNKFKPVKPNEVSEQVWNDLLILRKETKASNSQTAWTTVFNGLEKAQKATGHSLDQIITFWIGKAWKGFNADWYLNAQPKPQQTNYQGNNHANHQSANSQPNHFDQLRAEAAAKYGNTQPSTGELRTVN